MDRKAWIVIILCTLGIGVNFWFMTKAQEEQRVIAAAAAAAAPKPSETPAVVTPPAAPGQAAPTAAAAAPGTPAAIAAAPAATDVPEEKFALTRGKTTFNFTTKGGGIANTVLAGADGVVLNEVGKEAIGALRREAAGRDPVAYKIIEKTDKKVVFEGTNVEGIVIRKAYSLTEVAPSDEHLLDLTITLTNPGTAPYRSEEYYMYAGAAASMHPEEIRHPRFFWNDAGDANYKDTGYFAGSWFSKEKADFSERYTRLRFGGVMSRFYTTIVSHISKEDKPGKVWATRFLIDHQNDKFKDHAASKNDYAVQATIGLPPVEIAPGAAQTEQYQIYTGPKEYHRLDTLGGQRAFVMFYGWFTPISKVLTFIMSWLHNMLGNWGVAIILLTIIVRTCIWPIHAKSTYTMKRMGLLAPKMKELQEKYKADPQRQQVEVMKLYKEYGVNPLGGCLPMLLQIPIFFGFYSVLENAAELRGQPFLWVHDLSMPDTVMQIMGHDLNPLPLIMGVTMILQMKLTPQPQTQDKTQKIMFTIMPFFFLYICYNFAAALSLYWSTQNIFSIFQSWVMKLYMKEPSLEKVVRPAKVTPTAPGAPGSDAKKSKNRPPKLGG